jgi:hypothetical protein
MGKNTTKATDATFAELVGESTPTLVDSGQSGAGHAK